MTLFTLDDNNYAIIMTTNATDSKFKEYKNRLYQCDIFFGNTSIVFQIRFILIIYFM